MPLLSLFPYLGKPFFFKILFILAGLILKTDSSFQTFLPTFFFVYLALALFICNVMKITLLHGDKSETAPALTPTPFPPVLWDPPEIPLPITFNTTMRPWFSYEVAK